MDRIVTAMTTFLVLTAALVLFELVSGARMLRRDRPVAPPASHAELERRRTPVRARTRCGTEACSTDLVGSPG